MTYTITIRRTVVLEQTVTVEADTRKAAIEDAIEMGADVDAVTRGGEWKAIKVEKTS